MLFLPGHASGFRHLQQHNQWICQRMVGCVGHWVHTPSDASPTLQQLCASRSFSTSRMCAWHAFCAKGSHPISFMSSCDARYCAISQVVYWWRTIQVASRPPAQPVHLYTAWSGLPEISCCSDVCTSNTLGIGYTNVTRVVTWVKRVVAPFTCLTSITGD